MIKKFGKLEKVDLRELWNGEASDFTPWLSQEENIAELGEAIGMELEVQEQEQRVGLFRADILCKDVVTDHFVLIENQLERTDHTHLGQLMTYAAGLDAVTIIWIARSFAEEHRAALDWLNNITDESINFFGIEIEAYRIGESLPAPSFDIVAKPNDWTKEIKKSTTNQNATETQLLQQEYWQALKDYLEKAKSPLKINKPQRKSWFDLSLGRSNSWLSGSVSSRDGSISVWLTFDGAKAKGYFDQLFQIAYDKSMTVISNELIWDRMEDRKRCAIILRKKANYTEKKDWVNQFDWFKENLEKFDRFFRPIIKEL